MFKATSPGERLYVLISQSVLNTREITRWGGLSAAFRGSGRSQSMVEFSKRFSVLHTLTRVVVAAKYYYEETMNDVFGRLPRDHDRREMRQFLVDKLKVEATNSDLLNELSELGLDAARVSRRDVAPGARAQTIRQELTRTGAIHCYICGDRLDERCGDPMLPLFVHMDHIWPCSMGGISREANLLPVCRRCNETKDDMVAWEGGWHLSYVGAPEPGGVLKTPRRERIATLQRAAMEIAIAENVTLKEAHLRLGPLVGIGVIDEADTGDTFNIYVHDLGIHGHLWFPN